MHDAPVRFEREHRLERDVLELVGDDVGSRAELADRAQVVVRGDDLLVGDLPARRVRQRLEGHDAKAHPLRLEGQHPAELAAAEDPDRADHSSIASTSARVRATRSSRRRAKSASCNAKMRAANSAAFAAPPIAIVATGTPAGICAIENSESRPLSAFDFTGTPMTGSVRLARDHPGQVRGAAGAGDDHLDAARCASAA